MAWIRGIFWCVLLASLVGMGYFSVRAYRYHLEVESWRAVTLAEFPVDLSSTNSFTGTLTLITERPCKIQMLVVVESKQPVDRTMFEPVSGTITVADAQGKDIFHRPFHAEFIEPARTVPGYAFILISDRPWERGQYALKVSVRLPAPKLAGLPQHLIVKYELCGIEQMIVWLCGFFAAGCCVPALIAGVTLCKMWPKRRVNDSSDTILLESDTSLE